MTIQPQSVADGLGAPFAGRWTLAITRRLLDDIVLLDDPTILAGMRFALERLKQVVEPAGAAALAAVLAGRVPLAGRRARRGRACRAATSRSSRLGSLARLPAGTLPGASALVDAEVVEPVVVDAEVVGQLVDDRDPDLLGEVVGVGEVGFERQSEQRDPVGRRDPVGAVLRPGDALVQAVERVVRPELVLAELLARVGSSSMTIATSSSAAANGIGIAASAIATRSSNRRCRRCGRGGRAPVRDPRRRLGMAPVS